MATRIPARKAHYGITYANVPTDVVLAVGSSNPVGAVKRVACPRPGAIDTNGAITGWSAADAYNIKFTVTDTSPATTSITINGIAYTNGTNYRVVSAASLIIVTTTSQAGLTNAVRTFIVSVNGTAYANPPTSINLTVGSATPVGGVLNVGFPAPGSTDYTGQVTGWVASTACKIKFTVADASPAASTITINGASYTSGSDYTITAASTLTVIVTTTQTGCTTAVRTFSIPVSAAVVRSYLNVKDYGAVGNGSTADQGAFQTCMTAAVAANKWVYVPAGTYRFTSTLSLVNNAKIFGDGPTLSIIRGNEQFGWMISAVERTGIEIDQLGFYAPSNSLTVDGLAIYGCTSPKLSNLRLTNLRYSVKTGSHPVMGTNYDFDNIVAVTGVTGVYLTCITGGTFDDMDINAAALGGNQWHGMYMERDCNYLTFTNCKFSGSTGYAAQLYITGTPTSGNITFNNCTIDATGGRAPLVISSTFHDITFNDLTITGYASGYPNFNIYPGVTNLTVDTFVSIGPEQLVGTATVTNVLFKDGTHEGTSLGGGTGVTFDNVQLIGSGMSYANAPTSVTLAVGSTNPVGGVTNVAVPAPGGTDSTGRATDWIASTACNIKFTVVDTSPATSAITINGAAYTSGTDYTITSTASLTVVVSTTQAGRLAATRTFTITVVAPSTGDYLSVVNYGAKGNGVDDDTTAIQNCITQATSQSKRAYFPPGTYKITSAITIPSNANIFGYEWTQSVLYMPARYPSALGYMFNITNKSNVTIKHLGFKTDNIIVPGVSAYPSRVAAIWCAGCSNLTFDYLRFDEVFYALRTGSHDTIGTNYVWSNIKTWHCYSPIKLDDINGGTFTNWEIDAIPMSETNSQQWHGIYVERNLTNLTFTNTTWTRGSGYCIHMYNSAGGTGSHDITFTNTTIDARQGRSCMYIGTSGGVNPYYNITFNGLTMPGQLAANESQPMIDIDAYSSCSITGVSAAGYRLLRGSTLGNPSSVAGTFTGTMIGVTSPPWTISGLAFTYQLVQRAPPGATDQYPMGAALPGASNG